jgi:hypothetical protein
LDSSSSDSLDSQERCLKQRSSKKKKKKMAHHPTKQKGQEVVASRQLSLKMTPLWNQKKVYDLPVNGRGVDEAAGPLDQRSYGTGQRR